MVREMQVTVRLPFIESCAVSGWGDEDLLICSVNLHFPAFCVHEVGEKINLEWPKASWSASHAIKTFGFSVVLMPDEEKLIYSFPITNR